MSDFNTEMHKIRYPLRLRPRTRWRSSQHSPRLLVAFKGAYFYGEGGRGEKEKREGSEWKRRGKPPQYFA